MSDSVRSIVPLNGEWDLVFDPDNVGKQEEWFARFPRAEKIQVPGVWELIKPGYDGVGWYRKKFEVPDEWLSKTVRLRFMAAMYRAECWLNGDYLGDHEGGHTPFEYDISKKMKAGANEVVVRIINPPINYEIEGLRAGAPLNQSDLPVGKAGWYYNWGGLWQDVELIVTDKVYVEDCFAKPMPSKKKAELEVTVRNGRRAAEYEVTCSIAPWKHKGKPEITQTIKAKLKGGTNVLTVPMAFKKVHLWSPDDPFLYVATVRVTRDGELCDEYSVRFGMREFTIKAGRFNLNGKPIQLKGFLSQGMYPRTLCYPETREFGLKELKLVKDNGFNFIRAHLKPSTPWYLDMCDELGILVEGEPPAGWNSKSEQFERALTTEVTNFMRRDRNHPSVIYWCIVNEPHHYRGYTMAEIRKLTARIGSMARKIDPTRLLSDLAGAPTKEPGKEGTTQVMQPYTNRKAEMMDLHAYCPIPLHESSVERYRNMGRAGIALNICEYGAPLVCPDFEDVMAQYTPEEQKLGLEDYALHRDFHESLKEQFARADLADAFGGVREMLAEANKVRADEIRHITAGMRANTRLSGFALCQLADASGELFGATDVWRKPKDTFRQMASVMTTPLLMPTMTPRVIMPGDKVAIRVNMVNEDKLGGTYDYTVEVGKPRGKARHTFKGKVKAEKEVQVAMQEKVALDLKPGKYQVRARLTKAGKAISDQSVEFTVLPAAQAAVDAVGLSEPGDTIAGFLQKMGITAEVYSNNYRDKNIPVLMDMRQGIRNRGMLCETFGQLKKIVQLGGCAVLFEPEPMMLYEYLFPTLIRTQPVMRTIGYVKEHPVFQGLPSNCVVGYEYSKIYVDVHDKGGDVMAAGGEVFTGGLSQNMWTRPADFRWGVNFYRVPVGRGNVIVCNLKVIENLGDHRTAQLLMANTINYAASLIKPGGEEKLLSRCIDPLKPEDYA